MISDRRAAVKEQDEMKMDQEQKIRRFFEHACGSGLRLDEPMARHTTFGAGGAARYFAEPDCTGDVVALVRAALKLGIRFIGIGKGSNLVVRDGGFDGLVIKVASKLGGLDILTRTAHAEAGVSFTRLGRTLAREGRPGFEFAVGIPGSVGGAVRMNAGAWGGDVAKVLKSVKLVDRTGRISAMRPDQLGFGYRRSDLPAGAIILSAVFNCPPGDMDDDAVREALRRIDTQPLSQRSFGSTFKNPPGDHAARLIDECGLKGTRRGNVVVSEKHANFLINNGENTSANDVEDLMSLIVERVRSRFDITLDPEVIIIGNR